MVTTMDRRLSDINQRFIDLERMMSDPEIATDPEQLMALGRERSEIEDLVTAYRQLQDVEQQINDAELMKLGDDAELATLADEEIAELSGQRDALAARIRELLVPKDPNDEKSVIVEIRAGTGGDEAALFAADLYRMYVTYAERHGWKVEVMTSSETGIGGFREIIFEVRGQGAYSHLKYESGVHRVQRVPVTESSGRIHTSTATVAVLPEAEDVDVHINDQDLRVDVFRSTGHGGQSVNTTDSAVRITHLPTGIVVSCQDEKSQLKNRAKAMAVLRARLFDIEQQRLHAERSGMRRSQVGSGERSEKIRTYNVPQDRVTDHRLKMSLSNLPGVLSGNIDEFVADLRAADQAERLQEEGLN
ncbi:MAG TPA: peptide chain release factor 1 [Nitrolancea sp.]|nr:peptide chain release factor 1 [Nitrolancea sp.]